MQGEVNIYDLEIERLDEINEKLVEKYKKEIKHL